jgi:hypothetical protein
VAVRIRQLEKLRVFWGMTNESKSSVARVSPENTPRKRVPGQGKGAWQLSRDFDAPLPEDVVSTFEQELKRDRPTVGE